MQAPDDSDSDDRMPVPKESDKPSRKGTPSKIELVPRLEAVPSALLTTAVLKHEAIGRNVKVVPLNHAIRGMSTNVEMMWAMESRNCTSTVNFDVREGKEGFCPGFDEREGFAVTAWEIARELVEDENTAVIVVSTKGKDAPLFLAALAAKALARLDKKVFKQALAGKRMRNPRDKDLKRLVKAFSSWSEPVAVRAINSNCI